MSFYRKDGLLGKVEEFTYWPTDESGKSSDLPRRGLSYGGKHDRMEKSEKKKDRRSLSCLTRCMSQSSTSRKKSSNKHHQKKSQKEKKRQEKLDRKNKMNIDVEDSNPENERRLSRKDTLFRVSKSKSRSSRITQVSPPNENNPNYINRKSKIAVEFLYPKQRPKSGGSVISKHKREHTSPKATRKRVKTPILESGLPLKLYPSPNFNFNPVLTKRERFGMFWCFGSPQHKHKRTESPDYIPTRDVGLPSKRSATVPRYSYKRRRSATPKHKIKEESLNNQSKAEKLIEPGKVHIESSSVEMNCLDINNLHKEDIAFEKENLKVESSMCDYDGRKKSIHSPTYGIRSRKFSEFKESLASFENKPSVPLEYQSTRHHSASVSDPILEEITSSRLKKMADLRDNFQIFSENTLTKSNVFKNSLENELVFQETDYEKHLSNPSIQNCAHLREMLAHLSGNNIPNTVERNTVDNKQPGNPRSGTLKGHIYPEEQHGTKPGTSIGFVGSDENPRTRRVSAIQLRSFNPAENNSFDSIEIFENAQSLESYDSFCPSDYNFTYPRDYSVDSSIRTESNQDNHKYSSKISSKKSDYETKSAKSEYHDIDVGKKISLNKSDISKYSQINRNVDILSKRSENNSNITSSESIDCYLSQKNRNASDRESVDREINSIFDELSTDSKQSNSTQIMDFIHNNNSLYRKINQGLQDASPHSNNCSPSFRTNNMSQKSSTVRDHSRDSDFEKYNHIKISKESMELNSIMMDGAKEENDSNDSKLTYDLGNVSTHSNKIKPALKTSNAPRESPNRSSRRNINHSNGSQHKTKYNESIEVISEMGCITNYDSIKSELDQKSNVHINTNKSYNMADVSAKSSSKNKRHEKFGSKHKKKNYKTIDIHRETMGCFPSHVLFQIDNDKKSSGIGTHSNTTEPSSATINLSHYQNTNINLDGSNQNQNNQESMESNCELMGCIPNYDSIQSGLSHGGRNISYHSNIRAAPLRTINMSHIVSPKSSSNNKATIDDESYHNKKYDGSMLPNRENDLNSLDSGTGKDNIAPIEYPTQSTSTQFWNSMMQKSSLSNLTERNKSKPSISNRSYSKRSEEIGPHASEPAKTIMSPSISYLNAYKRQILTEKNKPHRAVNDSNVDTIPMEIEQDINGNIRRNHSNTRSHFDKQAVPEGNTCSKNSVITQSKVTSEERQVIDDEQIGNVSKILRTQMGQNIGEYLDRNASNTERRRNFRNQNPTDKNKHSSHSVVTMTTKSLSERRKPDNTTIEPRMLNIPDEPLASGYRERLVFSVDSNGDEYVRTIIQPLVSNIYSTRHGEHRTMVGPSPLNNTRLTPLHTPSESFRTNSCFIQEPPVRLPETTIKNNYNKTKLTPVPVISPAELPVRTKSAATNTILVGVVGIENENHGNNLIPNAEYTDHIDSKSNRTSQNDEDVSRSKSTLSFETRPYSKLVNRDQQLYQTKIVREIIPIYPEPETDMNSKKETDTNREESPQSHKEMATKEAYVACKCGEKIRFTVAVDAKDKKSCQTCYKRIEQEFTELLNDYKEQGFKPCGCRGNISVTDLVEGYMKEETVVCTCDDKEFVDGNNSSSVENKKQTTRQKKERDSSSRQGCSKSRRGSCGKQNGSSSKNQKETRSGKQEMKKFNTGKCAKNRCTIGKTPDLNQIRPHVFNVFHTEGGGEFKREPIGSSMDGCVTCRCGDSRNVKLDKMPDNVITCRCNSEELRVNSDFVGVVHCCCEETMATTAKLEVSTHKKLPLSRKRSTGKCHLEKTTSKPSFRFRRSVPIIISDNNTQKSNRKMKRRFNKARE